MPELLLELLSEEIPARMQKRASDDLNRLVCDGLKKAGLEFDNAVAYATPRRLTLVVTGLPEKQPDVKDERKGPQIGAPEQAINGFKSSHPEGTQIEERDLKGKTFYFAVIDKKGDATGDVLKDVIDTALAAMATSWPKSMRWGKNKVRWARPLHSIVCLFDCTVIPVGLGPVTASDRTLGHRFLAPEPFSVKGFDDYKVKLENAKVMLDAGERREKIKAKAETLAKAEGLILSDDPDLLDEVAGLVEWPVILIGDIDDEFMAVPPEVLIAAMRGHQKYFSTLNADGQLAAKFIFVSNMEANDGGKAIIVGNERVLRARLSDAKFFWDQDRKEGMESRLPKLVGVVFHAKLGSVLEKVERMTALAGSLSASILGADLKTVERAAKLSKADLVTGMVGELPELQGLMGRYYALESGEDADVADAIADHYSPAGPNDNCPSKPASVAVALADKIDTLVGFWTIDEKPTGSKDPFALRRAALGVIRLIIENNIRLSLLDVFATAGGKDVASDLLSFLGDRLKVHLKEKGVRHDLIDAVFALGEDDLVLVLERVDALGEFLSRDDGANLLAAYTRATNILKIEEKKDGKSYTGNPDPALLEEAGEKTLFKKLMDIGPKITAFIVEEKYTEVMIELASARSEIDAFFEKVTVNADQLDLRENRLNMLSYIRRALDEVADFSKIKG
jgi:glycyl-tRNA synthetase beta chain